MLPRKKDEIYIVPPRNFTVQGCANPGLALLKCQTHPSVPWSLRLQCSSQCWNLDPVTEALRSATSLSVAQLDEKPTAPASLWRSTATSGATQPSVIHTTLKSRGWTQKMVVSNKTITVQSCESLAVSKSISSTYPKLSSHYLYQLLMKSHVSKSLSHRILKVEARWTPYQRQILGLLHYQPAAVRC